MIGRGRRSRRGVGFPELAHPVGIADCICLRAGCSQDRNGPSVDHPVVAIARTDPHRFGVIPPGSRFGGPVARDDRIAVRGGGRQDLRRHGYRDGSLVFDSGGSIAPSDPEPLGFFQGGGGGGVGVHVDAEKIGEKIGVGHPIGFGGPGQGHPNVPLAENKVQALAGVNADSVQRGLDCGSRPAV